MILYGNALDPLHGESLIDLIFGKNIIGLYFFQKLIVTEVHFVGFLISHFLEISNSNTISVLNLLILR